MKPTARSSRPTELPGNRTATRGQPRTGATTGTGTANGTVATTPRLVPRTSAPSLSTGATGRSITTGTVARANYGYGYGSCGSGWSSYCWNPCYYNSWGCGWYGGWGCFGVSVSFWPWCWYPCSYWGSCYNDCWWNSWYYPYCAPTSYCWYPTSTYCPTYLYVPSSVVVVEGEPAGEVVLAGGAGERAEPAGAAPSPDATALAKEYLELGDFYFAAGRFVDAAKAYAKARGYAPKDASAHLAQADAVFAMGDYHFAAYLISEAARLDPKIAKDEADKRAAYGDPKLFDEHMKALDTWIESRPYDAQAHLVRGYNLRFSGKPDEAAAAFRRVLEISPENRAAATFLSALAPTDPALAPADPGHAPVNR